MHTMPWRGVQDMERNHQMTCPICMKSYADLRHLWQRLDNEISLTPMPEEYATWQVRSPCIVALPAMCSCPWMLHEGMPSSRLASIHLQCQRLMGSKNALPGPTLLAAPMLKTLAAFKAGQWNYAVASQSVALIIPSIQSQLFCLKQGHLFCLKKSQLFCLIALLVQNRSALQRKKLTREPAN